VAIRRSGETAEHGDDLDHDSRTPVAAMGIGTVDLMTYRCLILLLANVWTAL
jgi:hypothetical protein